MIKKLMLGLGTIATAIPVVTIVSCGKKIKVVRPSTLPTLHFSSTANLDKKTHWKAELSEDKTTLRIEVKGNIYYNYEFSPLLFSALLEENYDDGNPPTELSLLEVEKIKKIVNVVLIGDNNKQEAFQITNTLEKNFNDIQAYSSQRDTATRREDGSLPESFDADHDGVVDVRPNVVQAPDVAIWWRALEGFVYELRDSIKEHFGAGKTFASSLIDTSYTLDDQNFQLDGLDEVLEESERNPDDIIGTAIPEFNVFG